MIVIFGYSRPIWANLKPCSDPEDSELEICLTGIGKYHPPFPSTVGRGEPMRGHADEGHPAPPPIAAAVLEWRGGAAEGSGEWGLGRRQGRGTVQGSTAAR